MGTRNGTPPRHPPSTLHFGLVTARALARRPIGIMLRAQRLSRRTSRPARTRAGASCLAPTSGCVLRMSFRSPGDYLTAEHPRPVPRRAAFPVILSIRIEGMPPSPLLQRRDMDSPATGNAAPAHAIAICTAFDAHVSACRQSWTPGTGAPANGRAARRARARFVRPAGPRLRARAAASTAAPACAQTRSNRGYSRCRR